MQSSFTVQTIQRAKLEAWARGGIILREGHSYLVIPRSQAKQRLTEAVKQKNWGLVKQLSDQLQNPVHFDPRAVISKSFRMSFVTFARLVHTALTSNSSAARLLRNALVVEAMHAVPDNSNPFGEKTSLIRKAILETVNPSEDENSSAYSRDSYRALAPLPYPTDYAILAKLLWEELLARVPMDESKTLDSLGDFYVDQWADFLKDWGQMDVVLLREEDSVRLILEADRLPVEMDEDAPDNLGIDVAELDRALAPFMNEDTTVLSENCSIAIPIFSWKLSSQHGKMCVDDFALEEEDLEKAESMKRSKDGAESAKLEERLGNAISNGDYKLVSELSDELSAAKRRMILNSLAYKELLELIKGKPAVVSVSAPELFFALWSSGRENVDNLIAEAILGAAQK